MDAGPRLDEKAILISPTGLGMRNDPAGLGHYGAPRGKRRHLGYDVFCEPGQTVVCPVESGTVIRAARPYAMDFKYNGLYIVSKHLAIKIFYIDPWPGIIGKKVYRGEPIGIAQDITNKYNGEMRPHVHLAVVSFDPQILLRKEHNQ